jgi:hypothetical protein
MFWNKKYNKKNFLQNVVLRIVIEHICVVPAVTDQCNFFFSFISSFFFCCSMETSKRQVTIIDELWDNEESNAVRDFRYLVSLIFFFFFIKIRIVDCMMNKDVHYKDKILN